MLRIYDVCLEVVRRVRPLIDQVAQHDRDLARQMRKSLTSVPLNVAEGSGLRGGSRRHRYDTARGEANELRTALEVAEAMSYIKPIDAELADMIDHIIATLTRVVR